MPRPAGTHRLLELQRRLTCAASAAEEAHWRGYEHANLSLSMHLSLCQVEERATAQSRSCSIKSRSSAPLPFEYVMWPGENLVRFSRRSTRAWPSPHACQRARPTCGTL